MPGCALAIEEIFREAGFPEDLFRTLLVPVAARRRDHRDARVVAVTLTGSDARRAARRRSAPARVLKKTRARARAAAIPTSSWRTPTSSAAAETCAASRLVNSGQSCIAAKRFIVVERGARARSRSSSSRRCGAHDGRSAASRGTDVGPQARPTCATSSTPGRGAAVAAGARVLLGGVVPEGRAPSTRRPCSPVVKQGMPAYDEELFGPVAAVIAANDEADAVRDRQRHARSASARRVCTRDLGARRAARRGAARRRRCFVNALVKSDPRLPFGGDQATPATAASCPRFGIREFVNVKTVYVK